MTMLLEKPKKKRRVSRCLPDTLNSSAGSAKPKRGLDRSPTVTHPGFVEPARSNEAASEAHADTIARIRSLHSLWVASVLSKNRLNQQATAFVRHDLGFHTGLPADQRKKISADAAVVVMCVEKGEPFPPELAKVGEGALPFLLVSKEGRAPYMRLEKQLEKELEKLAESLPVWKAWAEGVRGLSAKALSVIVGEAGDLLAYANPAKLWKRMGLAPKDCYRMRTKSGDEAFIIPKLRRSRSWSITDILLRQAGPYQNMYRQRRAYELMNHPEFGEGRGVDPKTGRRRISKHGDLRARRWVEKRLMRDLWRNWWIACGKKPVAPHPADSQKSAA